MSKKALSVIYVPPFSSAEMTTQIPTMMSGDWTSNALSLNYLQQGHIRSRGGLVIEGTATWVRGEMEEKTRSWAEVNRVWCRESPRNNSPPVQSFTDEGKEVVHQRWEHRFARTNSGAKLNFENSGRAGTEHSIPASSSFKESFKFIPTGFIVMNSFCQFSSSRFETTPEMVARENLFLSR